MMFFIGCTDPYDDSSVWDSINVLNDRMSAMETVMNAYKNNLFITFIDEVDNGYVITFSNGSKATITNGKDGKNGTDGINGKDGKDGNNGETLIESIVIGKNEVTFKLTDGTLFSMPLYSALSIAFDDKDLVTFSPNSTFTIHYEIQSATSEIEIEVISSSDIKAKVIKDEQSNLKGMIEVSTGEAIDKYSKIVVLVSDGLKIVMKSISFFEEAGLEVVDNANKEIPASGGELKLEFFTNVPCEAIIPEDAKSWIEPVVTKAMEKQTLLFIVKENTGARRSTKITVESKDYNLKIIYTITQESESKNLTIQVNDISFNMIYVKGGTFWMGAQKDDLNGQNYDVNAYGDESPVHQVTLSNYYIGETEVTQGLWKAVMRNDNNPSDFQEGDDYPVENVSWEVIVNDFLPKLNQITGKTFVLPTEAQWEFAARGGTKSNGYKYSGSDNIDDIAWYMNNSDLITHPVGHMKPNELGIYDMTGNVFEWCSDWYGEYSVEKQTDPQGPETGSFRVNRGSSWFALAEYCHLSSRGYYYPVVCDEYSGFRLALLP